MSIVNNFKKILKSDEEAKPGKKKTSAAKKPAKATKEKVAKERKPRTSLVKKDASDKNPDTYKILKYPLITEKATDLSMINKYMFVVSDDTNKNEIKKAVESLYNVNVLDVNILKVPRKKRRRGRVSGWRSGFKKAVVTVKEGDKIEIVSH